MEHSNPLGTEKVSTLLYKFSVPAIIGMVVSAVYNIVDRLYIGNAPDIGSNGLAGITLGFPIVIILMAISALFGVGGSTLFAIKLGARENKEATKVLNNTFVALIVCGIICLILGNIFLTPLLKLFGASDAVLPFAESYMRIIVWGAPFMMIGLGLNNFLRAVGKPKLSMIIMVVAAVINIILDPLFIFTFKMGIAGAAYATIFSQFITLIWALIYFLGKNREHKFRLSLMKPDRELLFKIASLGVPVFAMQTANSLLNFVLNKSLYEYGGDIAVSGMGIVNSIQAFIIMPIIGVNQGSQPIISFNFGAKRPDRIKGVEKYAITAATIIALVVWIIVMIFPKQLVSVFNREPELVEFGSLALRSWFLFLPTVGFQILGSNFFQATGKPKSAMFLTLTRQVIFLIPAILIFPLIWGMNGLLLSAAFADCISAILTGIWFYYGIKKLSSHK